MEDPYQLLLSDDSMIRVGWDANIMSIQDEEFSKICLGSFITCYNPHCDKIFSIALPSKFVLSYL